MSLASDYVGFCGLIGILSLRVVFIWDCGLLYIKKDYLVDFLDIHCALWKKICLVIMSESVEPIFETSQVLEGSEKTEFNGGLASTSHLSRESVIANDENVKQYRRHSKPWSRYR